MQTGRHFLQIPGPTNTPLPILAALAIPTIDHRGPEFGVLGREVLTGIRSVFKTEGPVVIYPASGTGAWEAALVNTLSPGDKVLMYQTGWFATLWSKMAARTGAGGRVPGGRLAQRRRGRPDRRAAGRGQGRRDQGSLRGAQRDLDRRRLGHAGVRRAIDGAGHGALLLVDTISSLASIDYRHDEWGVDVTVGGSQKGLMMPPGLSFNAVSEKARAAAKSARLPAVVLGLGRDDRGEQDRLFSLHARDEHAAGAEGGAGHAGGRGAG
jgi:alanine-glyoxylate transaminase / serine-glyoxylate transaminase / serine-pyruvate transaminase